MLLNKSISADYSLDHFVDKYTMQRYTKRSLSNQRRVSEAAIEELFCKSNLFAINASQLYNTYHLDGLLFWCAND